MEAQLVPGKKFRSFYLVDDNNYLYYRHYNKKDDKGRVRSLWKCINSNSPDACPATATTKRDDKDSPDFLCSLGKSAHTHVADTSKIQKLKEVDKAKLAATNQPALKPREAFASMATNFNKTGEVVPIKYSALARGLNRAKAKAFNRPKTPTTYLEVIERFPEDLKMLANGSEFLLYAGPSTGEVENDENIEPVARNNNEQDLLLIFMSDHGAERLRLSNIWLCDGTFKTAPAPFLQVYIVFSQTNSGKVFPAAFCLLPSKNKVTYKKMWAEIQKAVNNISPATLVLDMEPASANAFISIFGQVEIHYCFFHWRYVLRSYITFKSSFRPF